MGFFSRWKEQKLQEFRRANSQYVEARNQVWGEEQGRIGKEEFHRRFAAVSMCQIGEGPPSGFEQWKKDLDDAVQRRAHEIAG